MHDQRAATLRRNAQFDRRERAIRRGFSIVLIATVFALGHWALITPAFAAEQRDFDIPAESADISVRSFVKQAGLSVMYEAGRLTRFRTRALHGKYEPIEGLKILLEGSGLEFAVISAGVISVTPKPSRASPGPESKDLPTVHIPGWRTRHTAYLPAGATVHRVTADDLAQAGFATIPDWVRTLTQNFGSGANENTRAFLREAQTNTAYGSGINFYGIGQRATLILVNGRRLAPSGSAGTFTDVSNIPISAIDHIDVISDGAATLYGSDALGGVVNFVLRGASSTPVTTVSIGNVTSGSLGEKQLSQSLAKQWDRGGGLLSLEYYSRSDLPASARSQATSDLTLLGGSDFNTLEGNPATIIDSKGRIWGVPAGQNGTSLTPAQLLPYPNTADREANTWLLPRQERLNLLASTTHQISDDSSIFFDALVNRRRVDSQQAPLTTALSVPNTNAFYLNPVAGNRDPLTVLYGFGKDLGLVTEQGQVNSGQFALGINHELSETWNFRGYVGYAYEDQHDVEHNLVNFGVLQDYLASQDRATAFNPFGDGSSTNPATLAAIRADGWLSYDSAFSYVNLSAFGAVPFLPAGPMILTMGSDYRVQTFATTLSPSLSSANLVTTPATNRDRTVSAVFLQSSAPVLDSARADRWPLQLDISGGLRYEHFSDMGGAISPSLGFDLQPAAGVSLQGTWARLTRPPNLPDLNEAPNISEVFVLADPRAPSGYTKALVWAGNNSGLRPETAHSWTLGLSLSPPAQPNFTAEASYFNIHSSNRIVPSQSLPLTLFSDPQYSYLFTRNVSAATRADVCAHSQFLGLQDQCLNSDIGALVDLRLRNIETLRTDGFDVNGRYGRETPLGTFGVNLTATYILHYKEEETPDGALVDYRNTPHNPTALRLRGLFNWERRGFSLSPAMNFQSSYTDTGNIPTRPVGSWMTWDIVLGYRPRPLEFLRGGETKLSLRGFNVFNKQPPFLNNSVSTIGYDPENGNLLGRRVSVAIEHKW
jgi:iron complex outermembrane recepter protein